MDTLTFIIALVFQLIILYVVIGSSTKTNEKLNIEKLQLKILVEMAGKLGVPEEEISKHFTSENIYRKFLKKDREV